MEFGTPSIIKKATIAYAAQFIHAEKNVVELPLYTNSTRGTIICSIKIPAGASSDTVSLSGAALIVADM